ncbi:MAG: glycosyltransferase family 2 protein [Patescibacteria group bacterium]|jgi:glycosyltransferase involved in cell wall biosynthesis
MPNKKLVSVVIPCYNEEKNINRTFDEILRISKETNYDFEIIAVNDGSKDGTWGVIKKYAEEHENIKGVDLLGNFGQSCAYMAGFDASHGDYIVTVSADLEIPIDNVKKVLHYLDEEGYDFVNTNRVGRWGGEHAAKSDMANKIITKVSKVHMNDRGSGVKGFCRPLIDNLRLYGEMHRFIPDYVSVYGAKMIEFEVEFKDRDFGTSAYKGSKKTIKVILDLVTLAFMLYFAKKPFTLMPGRLFGATGAVISGLGGLIGFYLFVMKILGYSIGDRPLLTLAVLMITVGIQSMMMGMIGELLMRTYFESSGRKTYVVRHTAN